MQRLKAYPVKSQRRRRKQFLIEVLGAHQHIRLFQRRIGYQPFDQTGDLRGKADKKQRIGNIENSMRIGYLARSFSSQALDPRQLRVRWRKPSDELRQMVDEQNPDQDPRNIKGHMDYRCTHCLSGFPDGCEHRGHAGPDIGPKGQRNSCR